MTLNITIISSTGIHQSADFRISRAERDGNGNWIELQPNSSKIVPLHFLDFFEFEDSNRIHYPSRTLRLSLHLGPEKKLFL